MPKQASSTAQTCHEEWEMDARGYRKVPQVGLISLIHINEAYSRVKQWSFPCWVGQHKVKRFPSTEDYHQALRLAFTR